MIPDLFDANRVSCRRKATTIWALVYSIDDVADRYIYLSLAFPTFFFFFRHSVCARHSISTMSFLFSFDDDDDDDEIRGALERPVYVLPC